MLKKCLNKIAYVEQILKITIHELRNFYIIIYKKLLMWNKF